MKTINKTNYHLSTFGEFKKFNEKDFFLKDLIETKIDHLLNKKYIWKIELVKQIIEELLNQEVDFHYDSKFSIYFLTKNEKQLIRVSNHWGSKIRSCNWFLKDSKPTWNEKGFNFEFGIINFDELKLNKE